MILVSCVDNDFGMLFNMRRQSQDREVRRDLIELAAGKTIWMNAYSARQFHEEAPIRVDDAFLEKAGEGEWAFAETENAKAVEDRIEKIVLYHWNRSYPADFHWEIDLNSWRLVLSREIPGFSHEKITVEEYVR